MIDVLPYVAELLGDIADVQLQFPDTYGSFPVITLAEIDNSAGVIISNKDRVSGITIQVDVWDNSDTPKRATELAETVNTRLTAKGFTRISGNLINDNSGLQRKCMRYRAYIDEIDGNVYSKI